MKAPVNSVKIGYPSASNAIAEVAPEGIKVSFPETNMAVFLEIELAESQRLQHIRAYKFPRMKDFILGNLFYNLFTSASVMICNPAFSSTASVCALSSTLRTT